MGDATPRPLYLRETDPVPIVQEAAWAQGRCAENLASIGIRSPDRPVFSKSLYRLSYPGLQNMQTKKILEVVEKVEYYSPYGLVTQVYVRQLLVPVLALV